MNSDKTDDSSEMDHFQNLSLTNNDLRFKSVLKIIHMFHKQDTTSGKLAVLRRLIRGLGATKHELRQGYYANFSCLLRQLPKDEFNFSVINGIIIKTLNPGSTSKQETGEAFLGQVLSYSALVHSNHLDNEPENLMMVASALIDLSTKRSYLCPQCYECLCVLISKVPTEIINENLLTQLKSISLFTLDKLLYLVYLQNYFPETNTIKEVFGAKKLLSRENAPMLADLILKSCVNYTSDHKFYESFCTKIAKKIRFTTSFWNAVCEHIAQLMEAKDGILPFAVTDALLKMCSELLKQVLTQELDPKYVDILVQAPLIKTILICGRKHSKHVQSISESICSLLEKVDDESRKTFIKKVMFPEAGSLSYDKISGTKTISKIIKMMNKESIKEISDYLKHTVDNKSVHNKERLIALNLYCSLLSHTSCYEDTDWRLDGLKFLMRSGFFHDNNFSVEFAGLIKNAFYSQISNRFPSLVAYTTVLKELVSYVNEGFKNKSLRIKIHPELALTWKHAMKLEKNIDTYLSQNPDEIVQSIYVLTLYMCLILFKEQDDTKINLQDIGSIYLKITKNPSQPKEGPAWIEVIMDLFLNLLSKPSSSHRHIIGCIFKYLVPHIDDQAFIQLVNVLNSCWTHKVFEDGRQADEVSDTSSEGSAEESEDDDDDDDTEEDTPDTPTQNEFLKESLQTKLHDILGPNNDDMSDVDVENIDEEEARRIDAALVEAFKTTAKLPANVFNARENNTMHFQIKVLDLIEIIAKPGMNCSKLLTIIPAVLNLYKTAVTKNQEALKSKLRTTINKIISSKVIIGETDTEEKAEVVTLIQNLLTQAAFGSGVNSESRPHLSAFSVFLIKEFTTFDNDNNIDNDEILNIVSKFIDQFFTSCKCHLQMSFFNSLIDSVWPGMTKFIKRLAEYSTSMDIKLNKRVEALKLLKNYFSNSRYFVNMTPEIIANIKKCGNTLLKFDDGSHGTLNPRYYTNLWNLISVFLKSKASSHVKWSKWKTTVQSKVYPTRKPVIKKKEMKRFKKMCSMLELPNDMFTQEPMQVPSMPTRRSVQKRSIPAEVEASLNGKEEKNVQTEASNSESNTLPNSNSKRIKLDVNKLKKHSRLLREAFNVGLEPNVFSNAAHLPMDVDLN